MTSPALRAHLFALLSPSRRTLVMKVPLTSRLICYEDLQAYAVIGIFTPQSCSTVQLPLVTLRR